MASLYAPHLTRWCVAMIDDGELDCVDYKGRPLIFQREDCRRLFPDDEEDTRVPADRQQGVPTNGREDGASVDDIFRVMMRCVEYVADDGLVLLLTVTKEEKKGVAEVDVVDSEVWVLGCGGHYLDPEKGTVEQVVDVKGTREAYALLIFVREVTDRIVRIKKKKAHLMIQWCSRLLRFRDVSSCDTAAAVGVSGDAGEGSEL